MDELNPAPPTLDYQSPKHTFDATRRLVPWVEVVIHTAFGVLLPPICFLMASNGHPAVMDPWQSGELKMYASRITHIACAWPFYPLLAYSMGSLMIAILFPAFAATRFYIRLGVYTGVVLALEFCVILLICVEGGSTSAVIALMGLLGTLLLAGMYELLRWLIRRFPGQMRTIGIVLAALAGGGALTVAAFGRLAYLLAPILPILIVAPMLTLASFLTISRLMYSIAQKRDHAWLWLLWTGAHAAGWWATVTCVRWQYTRLPTSQPSGCYIVTAAAGGHRWLVSDVQLVRLKFAELFLAHACPRFHFRLRAIYNCIGPPVAAFIRPHALLCDLAYCSLKPLEWLVVAFALPLRRSPLSCSSLNQEQRQ